MRLPATIDVNGHPYRVRVAESHEGLHRMAQPEAIAVSDHQREEIVIRGAAELSVAIARETLLHEVLHAVTATYKIRMADDAEEDLVDRLAGALLYVLRANPLLVEALVGRDADDEGEAHA